MVELTMSEKSTILFLFSDPKGPKKTTAQIAEILSRNENIIKSICSEETNSADILDMEKEDDNIDNPSSFELLDLKSSETDGDARGVLIEKPSFWQKFNNKFRIPLSFNDFKMLFAFVLMPFIVAALYLFFLKIVCFGPLISQEKWIHACQLDFYEYLEKHFDISKRYEMAKVLQGPADTFFTKGHFSDLKYKELLSTAGLLNRLNNKRSVQSIQGLSLKLEELAQLEENPWRELVLVAFALSLIVATIYLMFLLLRVPQQRSIVSKNENIIKSICSEETNSADILDMDKEDDNKDNPSSFELLDLKSSETNDTDGDACDVLVEKPSFWQKFNNKLGVSLGIDFNEIELKTYVWGLFVGLSTTCMCAVFWLIALKIVLRPGPLISQEKWIHVCQLDFYEYLETHLNISKRDEMAKVLHWPADTFFTEGRFSDSKYKELLSTADFLSRLKNKLNGIERDVQKDSNHQVFTIPEYNAAHSVQTISLKLNELAQLWENPWLRPDVVLLLSADILAAATAHLIHKYGYQQKPQ